MGNPSVECIALCNLGIVLDSLGLLENAQSQFELAVKIAHELRQQRSEGQALGYLALSHAKQGRFEDARSCLKKGEALLRAVSDRFSLGILKCSSAEIEYLAGALEPANAALDEAQSLAEEIQAGPKSELGVAIAHVVGDLLPIGRTILK